MVVGNVNKNNNNNNNNNTNNDHNNGGDGIGDNTNAHPSGIPREQIDNIMSGIANTGDVKMNNHRKKLRQRFDIIKKLGQGTYGKVQLGINKETGQEVAIKTIKKCKIEAEADLVRIRREVQIMSSVQHPNIIHIYEVFENREKMVLVMEFAAGGELYDYLSERKVLSEEEARRIFRQVATAVYYCHKHKICHRDLKLENILLDEYGNAKIADFGLSNVFDNHRLLATFCGSPLYASPEIVEGTPYQGPEVDCWSLGVLLYTLVYGSMPFDGSNFKRLVKQISQGDYYEPKKPSRASSLIKEMLTVCPQKRATIEQICSHWWVNENDPLSCLELAEDLANQTPVRLDVLLSLTPAAVTAEQLVVPSSGGHNMEIGKLSSTVTRSHSVGSLREIAIEPSTEAERRILDMVAAGGEAALMPSPTRTITPAHSPVQSKRKLETTLSTDLEAVKKKEKPGSSAALAKQHSDKTANATMETEDLEPSGLNSMESKNFSTNDMEKVGDICEQLMQSNHNVEATGSENETGIASCAGSVTGNKVTEGTTCQKTVTKLDTVDEENTTTPLEGTKKPASKVLKKFINKHKTADLVNVIEQITPDLNTTVNSESCHQIQSKNATNPSKKNSGIKPKDSQNEPQSNKVTPERRKSRILETAEKFQQMNSSSSPSAQVNLKPKKFVIPGVNVGSYKKEYERRASASGVSFPQISTEQQVPEEESVKSATQEGSDAIVTPSNEEQSPIATSRISLEEARRSMENSIALLRQAQSDSTEKDKTEPMVNQLCTKTENINMDDSVKVEKNAVMERERKLQNARTIIGNAIQPVLRSRPQLPSSIVPSVLLSASTLTTQYMGNSGGTGQVRWQQPISQQQSIIKPQNSIAFYNDIISDDVSGGGGGGDGNGNYYGYGFRDNGVTSVLNPLSTTTFNKMHKLIKYKQQQQQILNESMRMSQPQTSPHNVKRNVTFGRSKQNILGHLTCRNDDGGSYNQPITDCSLYTLTKNSNQILSSSSSSIQVKQFKSDHNLVVAPAISSTVVPITTSTKSSSSSYITVQQQQEYHDRHHHQKRQQHTDKRNLEYHRQSILTPSMRMPNCSATAASAAAAIMNESLITNINTSPKPFYNTSHASFLKSQSGNTMDDGQDEGSDIKTSTASITLKSATLPRRKTGGNTDVQLDIKPSRTGTEQSTMHFTTEMQHPIADLRTARDTRISYSPPIRSVFSIRAASLEPKEHIIPIQREPYTRTTSSLTSRSNSLSRQSTNDSDAETTSATSANLSQSTVVGSSQPIKKSPREFIIPIAVEGGGYIKPREDNTESSSILSHRNITSSSTFNRVRPGSRRISSLLNDDNSPFQKLRTSSRNRSCDGIDDEIPFTLHKLRSSRPIKKFSQETDSQSSGEEDDDDGFEILTAENLFSTLLQRVRALTNRLNVNHDITAGFPDSKRLFKNMRQAQNPFWNQEPFSRSQVCYTFSQTVERKHVRRNNVSSNMTAPWRHSVSRNMGGKMDSIFTTDANDTGASPSAGVGVGVGSGTGAGAGAGAGTTGSKLPRGYDDLLNNGPKQSENSRANYKDDEFLDLTDLDLSRLKLSKKDIETLSNITPGLPKCFQEQLLAKLPPTQARKLSRTLSVQNSPRKAVVKIYKRSQSGRRDNLSTTTETSTTNNEKSDDVKAGDLESTSNNATTLTTTTNTTATAEKSLHKSIGRLHQNSNNQNSELDTITSQKEAFNKNQEESNVTYATNNSLCSSCTTTISEKYKYYSPYIKKHNNKESEESMAQKNREIILNGTAVSLTSNDCELQLPPQPSSDTLTRSVRLSQRRLSKLFKPESGANGIYGKSIEEVIDDSNTSSTQLKLKSKKHQQDKEMVLSDYKNPHNNSLDQEFSHNNIQREIRFIKNKDIDGCHLPVNKTVGDIAMSNECRRSVSRSKEINVIDKVELADKILEELQVLSRMSSQQPVPSASYNQFAEVDDNSVTLPNASSTATLVKKVKKVKVKEKKSSDFTMKKSKKGNSLQSENTTTTTDKMTNLFKWEEDCNNKRESKLRRPKSYPSRTACAINENSFCNSGSNIIDRNSPDKENTSLDVISTSNDSIHHESRLLRLKSYPSTKLAADVKTSKQVIEENCTTTQESTLKSNETLSEINKKIKVAKKSKMQKPINTYTNLMPSKECNEINAIVIATSALKTASTTNKSTEKTSEKKTNKGLLHAIGQKFEKLRDSAMHKERRTATTTTLIISDDKNKDKHSSSNIKTKTSCTNAMPETFDNDSGDDNDSYKNKKLHIREKHFSDVENNGGDKIKKTDVKRSRIDTLIRTLRERSIPRQSSTTTKTNLNDDPTKCLKRAISAEELIDALQRKSSVSRVFGLFKRSSAKEKYNERHENKVRSTRSTSNIERSSPPIYENIQRNVSKSLIKLNPSNDDIKLKDTFNNSRASTACKLVKTISPDICLVCLKNQLSVESCNHCNSLKNNNKLKRNDLVLDLTKMQKIDNVSKRVDDTNTKYMSTNCKIVNANFYSSLLPLQNNSNSPSCYNNNNNNSYNTSTKNNNNNNSYNNNYIEEMCPTKIGALSTHDVNHCNNISNNNFLTSPSCKNMTYYSSDSKSCQDDCVSNCTLISPTEEKELYFDNWSVCSEENYGRNVTTPSPLFRAAIAMHSKSNLQSITSSLNSRGSVGVGVDGSGGGGGGANETSNDPNESVIDRIKRRSFYSRFNEKKPKRISSIVGPNVVREYYREQQSVMKGLKSSTANRPYAKDDPRQERDYKRNSSPDITQQFLRPLKLSPIGTELKPPIPKIINNNVSDKEYSTTASGSSGRSRKSLNDIRIPAMSTMSKQYDSSLISDNVYFSTTSTTLPSSSLSIKTSPYDSSYYTTSTGSYYSTYHPKRRSSYALSGATLSSTSDGSGSGHSTSFNGYATMGRKPQRVYDQKNKSSLESSSATSSNYRVEIPNLRDYSAGTLRYRTTSATRNPTNI